MSRYAMINDGIVDNVCIWDGNCETWTPPEGYTMVNVDGIFVDIGWTWDGQSFSAPPPQEEPPQ